MMESTFNVILVLQLLVNLGPLAVYFIILGLVNSQRHPRLLSCRADFVTLTVVFLPVLLWPVPFLVTHGWWWLLGLVAACVVVSFRCLLPRSDAGWVIYHTTEDDARAVVRHAVRRLGLDGQWDGHCLNVSGAAMKFRLSPFPGLGSVSIYLEGVGGRPDPRVVGQIQEQIERQLERRSLLPSVVGTCLVVVGIVLWLVPLWMMFRHMDAIVNVVQSFLFA
jgi:hypothetical protein